MKCVLSLLVVTLAVAGCGQSSDAPPPTFAHGANYAIVTTNAMMGGVPQAGLLSLHYYPDGPKGTENLVWPYVTVDDYAVFDKLVVFNGGLTEDITWKYYPALLAYAGAGNVVEISLLACRHIPNAGMNWTNYSFAVLSAGSNVLRLDASHRLPVNPHEPKRFTLELDAAEILKAVQSAQTNREANVFNSVKYYIAE